PADDPDGPRVGIHEVEPDVPYLIGVTTEAGLWSYRIADLVKFTQTRPPRIVFHGRREFFLNAFGEHVSQEELEGSIAAAASSCGCEVREFTVLPEFPDAAGAQGRHLWIVEFAHPPPDLDAFARSIDEAIMQGNDDYASHRAGDMQLRPPQVRLVRSGGFYEWMKARGRPTVPRIVDRDLVRGLLPPTA
ncbi:MAG: GH3 family domain-containing protein, partial [Planctomycetota bacterium]